MSCPIHKAGDTDDPGNERPVEEEGVVQRFLTNFAQILRPFFSSLVEALEEGAIDPAAGGLALELRERFDPYRESFQLVFTQGHIDGFETGREAAIRQADLEISFDVTHEETEAQIRRNAARAAEQVELTIIGNIVDAFTRIHREGMGIPEATALLQDEVFEDATSWKAEQVARTETISSANFGAFDALRDSAASAKIWEATDDERTRPTHVAADQQTVPIEQSFTVGGFSADYPGDPSLPPQERVNCRCAVRGTGFGI